MVTKTSPQKESAPPVGIEQLRTGQRQRRTGFFKKLYDAAFQAGLLPVPQSHEEQFHKRKFGPD